jgi:glutamate racemase
MSDGRPIGILDSGVGGLSVAREITRLMPGERMVYFGDTARSPLGNRPDSVIRACAREGAAVLNEFNIKLLVVASTTISAVALDTVEKTSRNVPVIGSVMPGARAAVLRTGDRKIGVVGMPATIRSGTYKNAISRLDESVQVYENAAPLLASLVDEMMLDHDITRLTAQFYLYEMVDIGVDCLILGSSCLPPLMEVIQGTVGTRMQLIDSALWTAKEVQDILTALDLRNEASEDGAAQSGFMFSEEQRDNGGRIRLLYGSELPSMKTFDAGSIGA